MALAACASEALWMLQLAAEMHINIPRPLPLFEDNQACITFAEGTKYHSRAKHIDMRYFFVKERVEDGTFKMVYCPTDKMLADMLTKPLPPDTFVKLRDAMGIVDVSQHK